MIDIKILKKVLEEFEAIKVDGVNIPDWRGPNEWGIEDIEDPSVDPDDPILDLYDQPFFDGLEQIHTFSLQELFDAEIGENGTSLILPDGIDNIVIEFFKLTPICLNSQP